MLICVDSFAPSEGNDLFSFDKNGKFTRTLGQQAYEHMLLIFNPCFSLEYLSIYPQDKILGSLSNILLFSLVAALHVSLPSAQSSD